MPSISPQLASPCNKSPGQIQREDCEKIGAYLVHHSSVSKHNLLSLVQSFNDQPACNCTLQMDARQVVRRGTSRTLTRSQCTGVKLSPDADAAAVVVVHGVRVSYKILSDTIGII